MVNALKHGQDDDVCITIRRGMKAGNVIWTMQNTGEIPDGFDLNNVIFLTAYSEPKFVEQASQYGALCYLVKPIDPIQMGPVVKAALDRADELRSLRHSKLDLQAALDQDRIINVAIGIAMVRHKLNRKAASDLLRSASRNQRCKLIEVAKKLVQDVETSTHSAT